MDERKAREILQDAIDDSDGGLFDRGHYIAWSVGDKTVVLDAEFTADELEAIAWWMRNKNIKGEECIMETLPCENCGKPVEVGYQDASVAYHRGDFWCTDCATKEYEALQTKKEQEAWPLKPGQYRKP